MPANKTMLFLPGDGIGPEAMREVRRVIDWFDRRRAVRFDIKEGLVGGASIDAKGTPITDETMADAMSVDAVSTVVSPVTVSVMFRSMSAFAPLKS